MTEIEQEMQELEERRKGMVTKMKARLRELDSERNHLRSQLAKLEGKGKAAAAAGASPRKVRSQLGNLVISIIREAGAEGLNASETVDEVLQEEPDTERGTVLTHLSRMAGRGMLVKTGDPGFYQYIAVEHVGDAPAPAGGETEAAAAGEASVQQEAS